MEAVIADPEKASIARQWHGKYLSMITNNYAATDELLEVVFSMWFVPRVYKENQ
jgi:hypothetical protein